MCVCVCVGGGGGAGGGARGLSSEATGTLLGLMIMKMMIFGGNNA